MCYRGLTAEIRVRAVDTYKKWMANNSAGKFKTLSGNSEVCTIRVGRDHRAAGIISGNTVTWFFIGTKEQAAKAGLA